MSSIQPIRPMMRARDQRLVSDSPTIDGSLLTEVCRVQHDKTLLMVRDAVERIATMDRNSRSYSSTDRRAEAFKADVLAALRSLRDEASR